MLKKITTDTLIPLSLVITLLGGSAFVTRTYYMSSANAQKIEKIEKIYKELRMLHGRLARIEGLLERRN